MTKNIRKINKNSHKNLIKNTWRHGMFHPNGYYSGICLDYHKNDLYEEELRSGKYRDMEKIYKSFELRGIDINKI